MPPSAASFSNSSREGSVGHVFLSEIRVIAFGEIDPNSVFRGLQGLHSLRGVLGIEYRASGNQYVGSGLGGKSAGNGVDTAVDFYQVSLPASSIMLFNSAILQGCDL